MDKGADKDDGWIKDKNFLFLYMIMNNIFWGIDYKIVLKFDAHEF